LISLALSPCSNVCVPSNTCAGIYQTREYRFMARSKSALEPSPPVTDSSCVALYPLCDLFDLLHPLSGYGMPSSSMLGTLLLPHLSLVTAPAEAVTFSPFLQGNKLKLREVKSLAERCTARKRWNWDSNPDLSEEIHSCSLPPTL
jgi:hypothetical protein